MRTVSCEFDPTFIKVIDWEKMLRVLRIKYLGTKITDSGCTHRHTWGSKDFEVTTDCNPITGNFACDDSIKLVNYVGKVGITGSELKTKYVVGFLLRNGFTDSDNGLKNFKVNEGDGYG